MNSDEQQHVGIISAVPVMTRRTGFILLAALLVVMTVVAYLPATQAGYIWDDNDYVTENPLLPAPDGLWRIWFSQDVPSQYFPMVYTSFRFEYALWELEPFGYHLTNIILHTINALLLWWLLSRLGIPGAWLVSAIFALHPVHVESVAWITERKNVLMAFFFFLSLLTWMQFADRSNQSQRAWPVYILSLLLYVLALLSKTTACMLPAALVLVIWLKHIKLDVKRWLQIIPYLLLGLAMGIFTVWWEQKHVGTGLMDLGMNAIERMLVASRALWFYIGKLLWPVDLAFSYPYWKIDATDPLQYSWLLACIIVAWGIWHWRNKLGRGPIAAVIFFIAMLFPMLGFFSLFTFLYTYVADHYQYVASIGPIALVVTVAYRAANRFGGWAKGTATVIATFVLMTLGTLTWRQCHIYKDIETLWSDTLRKNPDSWLAHNNLGATLAGKGRMAEAITHYAEALSVRPKDYMTHNNIGFALQSQGKLDEAIGHYRMALQIIPTLAKTHNNLGTALGEQGKFDEAMAHYRKAMQINPDFTEARDNVGITLQLQGKFDEAINHYRQIVRNTPNLPKPHHNLGIVLFRKNRIDEAIEEFREALRLGPNQSEVHKDLGVALLKKNRIDEAMKEFSEALRLKPDWTEVRNNLKKLARGKKRRETIAQYIEMLQRNPDDPDTHNKLAQAFYQQGKLDEAIRHWSQAIRLKPDWAEVHNNLAWVLATIEDEKLRNPAEAVRLAQLACELTDYKQAEMLDTLGVAYAAAGRFAEAVKTAEKGIELALDAKQEKMAQDIRSHLKLYKINKPYRD